MRRRTAVAALALLPAWPAAAHHGWSQYEGDRPLTLTGTIAETSYEFPHGTIRLKAADKTWTVVLAPPSRMTNRGLSPDALKVGVSATVMGYPHKSIGDELRAERITLDGTTTELR
jgi:hypothetical protein